MEYGKRPPLVHVDRVEIHQQGEPVRHGVSVRQEGFEVVVPLWNADFEAPGTDSELLSRLNEFAEVDGVQSRAGELVCEALTDLLTDAQERGSIKIDGTISSWRSVVG